MVRPILKKKKVSEIIIDEIMRMVVDGELKEGDRLPDQNTFASELGVSRPSLREALNQLTFAGVVQQKPGAGTILLVDNPDLWFQFQKAPVLYDVEATMELLEARRELEQIAIRLAVARIDNLNLHNLEHALKKMIKYYENNDVQSYQKEDYKFHYLLAKASQNRYILQSVMNLKQMMEEFMDECFRILPNLFLNSLEHHKAILEAVTSKNEEKAVFKILEHLNDIQSEIQKYYKEKGLFK